MRYVRLLTLAALVPCLAGAETQKDIENVAEVAPAAPHPGAKELISQEAARLEGPAFKRSGAPIVRSLEAFKPVSFKATRGSCYWLVFALDKDGQLSPHAQRGLGVEISRPKASRPTKALPKWDEPNGRVFKLDVGCPQTSGSITVDLQAMWGSGNSRDRIHELGRGRMVFQVLTRKVSESALKAQAAKAQRHKEENKQSKERYRQERCDKCRRTLQQCSPGARPSACKAFQQCMLEKGAGVSEDCGF